MTVAVITLSEEGANLATRLSSALPDSHIYLHGAVSESWTGERFAGILELTEEIFRKYSGLIYITPCGVAVRAIAPHLTHKTRDPAVVVVDAGARWAISLLSGHEGGANELAVTVGNILSAEPVISTTTEALKNLIVGIGCRKGIESERIIEAVTTTLKEANLDLARVRLLSSADVKANEKGLLVAAQQLRIPVRFMSSDEIRGCTRDFQKSNFVEEHVNVPAVAEPCALLAGRRTRLVIRRKTLNGVTVAVAEESCM
ncbi:MAG TPA: cobalamin biosynthesis protein [Desulfomonilaceae bacterium]|nr:cobalamin biosynthesis protein [Desulfomonilaceae bacterium]